MDFQLQELIDKIKKDGVSSAEEAAAQITANAEKKAASSAGIYRRIKKKKKKHISFARSLACYEHDAAGVCRRHRQF